MSKNEASDVPPTEPKNPDVGRPTVAAATMPRPKKAPKTKLAGKSLMPDLDAHKGSVSRRYWYWLGVTPGCPVDNIDIAGIGFPKLTEKVSTHNRETVRIPVPGHLVQLGESEIRRMRDRLPRTVIRFLGEKPQHEEPGTGMNVGDTYSRGRKGHLITIPRDKDVQEIEKQGRAAHRYEQGPNDQPAARYMFALLCDNQDRPAVGSVYPETLETTGLEWPDEIKD